MKKVKRTMSELAKKENQIQLPYTIAYSDEVKTLSKALEADPNNPELWMKKGLAYKKQMCFREAIEAYSMGLTYDPFNMLLYRHRGHAYVNISRYAEAAADFEMGLRIDPENWDCWYHLGLAYHLMKDFKRAKKVYEGCRKVSYDGDSIIAVTDWYWITCMRMNDPEAAQKMIDLVDPAIETTDYSGGYKDRVMVYKGLDTPEHVLEVAATKDDHMFATYAYGIAVYYETHNEIDKAMNIYHKIVERDELWAGFAEHAAYERLYHWDNK
ncbi:MAG TPA: tetratricopeptide repeat protein [Dielma fastidiosa]|nr:tetratricopeptide repeat protein [Dielma fastidiosa]